MVIKLVRIQVKTNKQLTIKNVNKNYSYLTSTTIDTKVVRTLIGDSDFTIFSSPSWRTRTSVWSLSSVETSGSILACGWVVGAIIQILVAKKATPAFFAMTSPRLIASTMLASWIFHAFVARFSSPAISTSVRKKKEIINMYSILFSSQKFTKTQNCRLPIFFVKGPLLFKKTKRQHTLLWRTED